ncbi:MAG: PD40 domain-containing protein [Candidatus Aminicenantes bacterium]|nr:PD40 domain-containing protein [Candidatus Aminicenantes bacterium]
MKKTIFCFSVVFLSALLVYSGQMKKMTLDDCFRVKEVSDVRISPEGKRIAFVMTEIVSDEKAKDSFKRTYDIYSVRLADNTVHRLTTHEQASYYPRWSKCGRYLAFLSGRKEKNQIWLLDMELGGEANNDEYRL